jgi:hypothetical protein
MGIPKLNRETKTYSMINPTPETVLSETATTEPCPPKRTDNAKEIVTFYSYNVVLTTLRRENTYQTGLVLFYQTAF